MHDLIVSQARALVYELFKGKSGGLEFFCACDQAGTLKLLTDKNGAPIKEVVCDSFGVTYYDSLPELFMPIGFGGGLVDPDTGLIRFGWRDYDPTVGRFTASDPARDTRGDNDLYDYCVDDPVSRRDPEGLAWWTLRGQAEEGQNAAAQQAAAPQGAVGALQTAPQVQRQETRALTQTPLQERDAQPLTGVTGTSAQGRETNPQTRTFRPERAAQDALQAPKPEQPQIFIREEPQSAAQEQAQSQTDAKPLVEWKMDLSLQALVKNAPRTKSLNECAKYVRRAIEAGGLRLNLSLRTAGSSARGYGPALEDVGFVVMPEDTEPQAGDVAIFDKIDGHEHGHICMFNGQKWISDFVQKDIYAGEDYRQIKAPYVLYRRSK